MATSDNILTTVSTYQKSFLARLLNMNCFINIANKKFKNFNTTVVNNLGATVQFDTPPRFISNSGLVVASFGNVKQETRSLTIDQARNVNFAFDAQQLITYVDNNDYRDIFEKSAIVELGSYVEQNIASVIPANTFRFYSAGVTGSGTFTPSPINSFGQLADIGAKFKEFGAAPTDFEMVLPNLAIPAIINSGLNQFVLDRNERIANSWELGRFAGDTETYRSNLLPLHTSGTTGNAQSLLTITAVTRQADGGITQITASGAANSDASAVLADDVFEFQPTSGQPDVKFLTYNGHATLGLPFQFRATATAGSNGSGVVVINVSPVIYDATSVSGNPLVAREQNTNVTIAAGMTFKGQPTHRCGVMMSGKPLFIAMPMLPKQDPFPTANESDEQTGASLRLTTGSQFGGNSYGTILDIIWGKALVDIYSMRLIFPPSV